MTKACKKHWRHLGLIIITLLISACNTAPKDRNHWGEPIGSGDFSTSSNQDSDRLTPLNRMQADPEALISQANTLSSPKREEVLMFAAKAYLDQGNANSAQATLDQIKYTALSDKLRQRKQPLLALIYLVKNNEHEAQRILEQLQHNTNTDPVFHDWRLLALSNLALRMGSLDQAIHYLTQRQASLNPDYDQQHNLHIWQLLSAQPRKKLERARLRSRDTTSLGWIELALITKKRSSLIQSQNALNQWRRAYPGHPAINQIIPQFVEPDNAYILDNLPPESTGSIALLLPISSTYKNIAQAVADGFIAASGNLNTQIRIYDISPNNEGIRETYEKAIYHGAQIIVGPLGNNAVTSLVQSTTVQRPTILLGNVSEDSNRHLSDNIYQFSLDPEQQARALANQAYQRGYSRAAILFPDSNHGKRLSNAFSTEWRKLGATITITSEYENDLYEIDTLVDDLFQYSTLPPDLIFLASNAQQSRLLTQAIKLQSPNIAIYATSSIFSGKSDQTRDFVLDNVVYSDMPWMYPEFAAANQKRQTIQTQFKSTHTSLDRYYAFGVDAYQLAQRLRQFRKHPGALLNGVTGRITLTGNKFFLKQPFLQYINSHPIPIN